MERRSPTISPTSTSHRSGPGAGPLLTRPVIALFGAIVHLSVLGSAFVYDDHRVVLENLSLRRPWDWASWIWHSPSRPLVNVTYALDYALWHGPNAAGFHLTNLAIHVLNILLVHRAASGLAADQAVGRRQPVTGAPSTATVASLLFAVHPVLTSAVGYISARTELLCTLFLLVAFNAARSALRGGSARLWLVAVASWMGALASKEIAVMFPVALFVYDRVLGPDDGARRHRLMTVHAPWIGVSMAAAALRLFVFVQIEHRALSFGGWSYTTVQLDVLRRYVQMMFVPAGQALYHAIPPIPGMFAWRAVAGLVTLVLLVATAWRLRRRYGVISVGLSWFGLLLVPSAVLVQLGRAEPMAEHRLYAAAAGLFLAAGGAVSAIEERTRQRGTALWRKAPAAGFVIVAMLAATTVWRYTVWRQPVSLWSEAVRRAPGHWAPRLGLGQALHEAGRHDEAIEMYRESLRLRPAQTLAYSKLGQCQLEVGDVSDARDSFARLQALVPDSAAAAFGLGLVALRTDDAAAAREDFRRAFQREPTNVPMRQTLARLIEDTDPAGAKDLCEEIRELAPQTPGINECISRNQERLRARD